MEKFEVSLDVTQQPILSIEGFEDLKKQASGLVEEMKKVEVTEENIQGSKKLVAEVKKKYDLLDAQRKDVKKELLKPLNTFTDELKDLKTMLDEGDTAVRNQIKELELKEREARKVLLHETYIEYISYYKLPDEITFEDVLDPKLLNKSVSLKKATEGIRERLNELANDVNFIETMIEDLAEQTDVMIEWLNNGYNSKLAVKQWKDKTEQFKKLYAQQQEKEEAPVITIEPTVLKKQPKDESRTLVVYGLDEVHKVTNFLLENKIQFKQI